MEAEHNKVLGMNANTDRYDKFAETFISLHKASIDRLFAADSKLRLVDTLDPSVRKT